MVCLLFIVCLVPVLTEAEAQENLEGQGISQIILVPYSSNNNNYQNADPKGTILDVLVGSLHLLPDEMGADFTLINQGTPSNVELQTLTSSMITMMKGGNTPKKCINAIDSLMSDQTMEKTAILVLDCSGNYDDEWTANLTGYADRGAKVFFVEIQNQYNAKRRNDFAAPFHIPSEYKENQLALSQSHPNLSYAWISDPDLALDVFCPFIRQILQKELTRVESGDGVFNITPFASLTASTDVIIPGAFSAENVESGTAAVELIYQNPAFTYLRVGQGTDRIQIAQGSVPAIYASQSFINTDGISLQLGSSSSRTQFEYQDKNELYAWIDGSDIDPAVLAQDLINQGLQPVITDQDNRETVMTWDPDAQRWTGSVLLDHSGEWNLQVLIRDKEGKSLFQSNTYSCTVTIKEPEIQLGEGWPEGTDENPVVLWTFDPWNPQTYKQVEIPFQTVGKLSAAANSDMNQTFVPDVGDLKVNAENNKIEIVLNNYQVSETKDFDIYLVSDIGEIKSQPKRIHVTLHNLAENIRKINIKPVPMDQTRVQKNQNFTAAAVIEDEECNPDAVVRVRDHLQLFASVIDQDGKAVVPPVRMSEEEKRYTAELRYNRSGKYSVQISGNWEGTEETEEFESAFVLEPIAFSLEGSKPVKSSDNIPDQEGVLPINREQSYWETEKYKISDLFTETDNDMMTVAISVLQEGSQAGLHIAEDGIITLQEQGPSELSLTDVNEFAFRLTGAGAYQISIKASDEDGESESYRFTVNVKTLLEKILDQVKKYGVFALAGIILLIIVLYLLKPSFKGKTLDMTVTNEQWNQSTQLDLAAWGKTKKKFYYLLTCCACPPDPALYEEFAQTWVKPTRRGIKLKGVKKQTGQKTARIDENHSFSCSAGPYRIAITVKKGL